MPTATDAIFRPLRVGTMSLQHRLVVPPHSGGGGLLLGTEEQFERHCRYWLERVAGGMQWVGGGPMFVQNPLIPGFEPSGIGSNGPGFFRHPDFVARLGRFMERIHAAGGYASVQLVLQGGMPIAPSQTLSGYLDHAIPHELDRDEITWLVREYGESAALAAAAGADAIELHTNHDDVLQWFLSPRTNRRTDGYGGDLDGRTRIVHEICAAIRERVDRPITLGLRLCLDELIEGGYDTTGCSELVAAFTAAGAVDYFSLDIGGNWGAPSYVPIGLHPEGEWAPLAGQVRRATHLPIVYAGRVVHPDVAARILDSGAADLVAMARATIADPHLVRKLRAGDPAGIRPCIAVNDCINRRSGEGLMFACAVNPQAGQEFVARPAVSRRSREIVVVGAGPAGTEFAALSAERGHRVRLLERGAALGGQLAVAALARMNHQYADWIDWQTDRLRRLGVDVQVGTEATADALLAAGADLLVLATGAVPRLPEVPGIELPHVMGAVDVLRGERTPGQRVVVVAEDDRAAPLAVADHLAGAGHAVTLVYQSPAPSPQVGKYSIGSMLARMDAEGVRLIPMTRAVGFEPGIVRLANSYSGRRWSLDGVDSVVLACGSVSDDALYHQVRDRHPDVHRLGDAYAPRRLSFATRQAWELARTLD